MNTLLGAAALALITAAPVAAAPINLNFSFDGVTGTFYGLDNDDGRSSATSFDLFGVSDTFLDVVVNTTRENSFFFSGGVLKSLEFLQEGSVIGTSGAGALNALALITAADRSVLAASSETDLLDSIGFTGNNQGLALVTQTPVTAVPLPAGALLLLSGLAGITGLKRRKKRTA